ncbi:hypothetical protein ACVWZ4_001381 [Bradyrhizobium sp. USDA 4472]
MPDRKRLGLNSPTDLLAKLHWEIGQLGLPIDEEAIASYRAFNCAVTAWSIATGSGVWLPLTYASDFERKVQTRVPWFGASCLPAEKAKP